ncbi:MAG: ISL3 family transposase [Methyloprofundus sp.]|nr:ISL3 family transposase [Methyloprofundus sp.]
MSQPQIQIPLDLPNVRVENYQQTDKGLVITVVSTCTTTECRQCGRTIDKFHGYGKAITLRHLPIFDRPVWIRIRPKRFQCPYCDKGPTTSQRCEWYEPKSPHTKAYENWILRELVNSTLSDVSLKQDLSVECIEGILDRHIRRQVDWSAVPRLELLGIDEIALKKGHKDFVVIVSGLTAQREKYILAVLPDRKKETVKAFLKTLPPYQCQSIRQVCIDMNEGYGNAVLETLPKAQVVVDRFHVAKHYRDCADKARKIEMKRLRKTLPESEYAQLKGVMWAFRKPWAALTEEQQVMLLLLFQHAPILRDVYVQREVLTGIFERRQSKTEAEQALTQWLVRIKTLGLDCFAPFITTLDNWRDKITNYFIGRETSGFVEGLNNKIKVIKRRCYGIYNLGRLFQHIWLDVQGRQILFAKH